MSLMDQLRSLTFGTMVLRLCLADLEQEKQ